MNNLFRIAWDSFACCNRALFFVFFVFLSAGCGTKAIEPSDIESRSLSIGDFEKYRLLAMGGDVKAQSILGRMYFDGTGVSRNPEQAIYWLKLAADKGRRADVQYYLSRVYASEEKHKYAYLYGYAAAVQGHAKAAFSLGMRHMKGIGTRKDKDKAITWFQHAAKFGDPRAINILTKLYMSSELNL